MKHYSVLIRKNKENLSRIRTHSLRRFLKNLSTIKSVKANLRIHLTVNYGRFEDNRGKKGMFSNEGIYYNYQDCVMAFKTFNELKEKDFI